MAKKKPPRNVVPLWESFGFTEDEFISYAHEFGAGPVTVVASERWMVPSVAAAVNSWNKSIGIAVFKMDTDPEADIRVNLKKLAPTSGGEALPNMEEGLIGPEWWDYLDQQEQININKTYFPKKPLPVDRYAKAQLQGTISHELGHIAGLDHPDSAIVRAAIKESKAFGATDEWAKYWGTYRDPNLLMSGANVPAPAEAAALRETYEPIVENPNRLEREREHREAEPRRRASREGSVPPPNRREFERGQL